MSSYRGQSPNGRTWSRDHNAAQKYQRIARLEFLSVEEFQEAKRDALAGSRDECRHNMRANVTNDRGSADDGLEAAQSLAWLQDASRRDATKFFGALKISGKLVPV